MKKAVIYARVSTIDQRDSRTIERQIESIETYCKEHELTIVDRYLDDGVGGSDKERGYRLIDYVQSHAHTFDVLVFESIDRFSRNLMLCGYLQLSCLRENIDMISIYNDGIFDEEDPMKKFQNTIIKAVAELDKDMTVMKLQRGINGRVRKGYRSRGNCPLGYEYKEQEKGNRHDVIVNEQEAEIVKGAFRTFLDTGSLAKTARTLNKAGFTTRRKKAFSRQGVKLILQNDFYIGKLSYNGETVDGQHEPLISKHLFTKVQKHFQNQEEKKPCQ